MFRIRRYRVFLVFAIISIGLLYHFTSLGEIESAGAASVEGLRHFGQKVESSVPPPTEKTDLQQDANVTDLKVAKPTPTVVESEHTGRIQVQTESLRESQAPAILEKPEKSATQSVSAQSTDFQDNVVNPKATPVENHAPPHKSTIKSSNKPTAPDDGPADPIVDGGGGRLEIIPETTIPKIHWSQMPEHFPVPTENLIQLPSGKPKAIPRIQHDFPPESPEEKASREEKRAIIKKAFSFSWDSYKEKAWMQDELSPVSGKFRNPFCAWGATLVDSLDTLFMMGLTSEFEEAVEAVRDIDFTTSPRNDIPLFETVIRYLGGLVAAYDISDGAHRILLDKAVELAEILMGAFDTPNRMPMTFYLWKPTFASQPHRAKVRVVLAELGSLSVEFTRLAQITKEAKYYDAIARITNEFEDWQNNTRLPGLWPMKVDASGCKKPDVSPQSTYENIAVNRATNSKPLGIQDREILGVKTPANESTKRLSSEVSSKNSTSLNLENEKAQESLKGPPGGSESKSSYASKAAAEPTAATETHPPEMSQGALGKRQVSDEMSASKPPECEPQGLASPPYTTSEEFGIGGQADSTYEYLPKEYMLLGGLEEKYRTIYETAADVITKKLLYRTMIPDEKRRVLHPGLAKVSNAANEIEFKPEGSHLGCFAGGMYAVGAKIFGREGDLKIAKELTDGCVWAYEATATGIMPDGYVALQCPDPIDCPWNETLYYEKLDPYGHLREENRLAQQQSLLEADQKSVLAESEGTVSTSKPTATAVPPELISPRPDVNSLKTEVPVSQWKAEYGSNESPENRLAGLDSATPHNNILESTEGTPQKQRLVAEQSAEHSASLPAGGVSVEQPVSPPPVDGAIPSKARARRQLGEIDGKAGGADLVASAKKTANVPPTEITTAPSLDKMTSEPSNASLNHSLTALRTNSSTSPSIPSHDEFVKARIKDERLPAGMTKVTGAKYLLRPEAIESVFIMYRATGDAYWRERGWEMFKAIEKHTAAKFGGSAILDVTSDDPTLMDEMESFWLAETLKYFYLLFSEPSLVSLDDYVLNTEAHPFKRPG